MNHIEAMKLALEALEKADSRDGYLTYITEIEALREALAEQPAQDDPCIKCKGLGYYDEGHECDDGSMAGGNYVECDKCKQPDFIKHEVENAYDWSEWVCPDPESYLMKCCDCGLVHEAQFRVAKYKPAPSDECEVVSDPDLQAQFRMRRSEQWSPADTAHRPGGLPMAEQPAQQEPVKVKTCDTCQFGERCNQWSCKNHSLWKPVQPAQRKPLTDEQRNTIISQECRYTSEAATEDHHRLIEAVELLHGIKEKNT